MLVKLLEIRDANTMIIAFCCDLNPEPEGHDRFQAQRSMMRRYGFPCDGHPNIGITHMNCHGDPFQNDPYYWKDRTWQVAHNYIIDHWAELQDGDVVDVEFILGETTTKKQAEWRVLIDISV